MHNSEIVQRAIDYVEDNLFETISLDKVADAAAMSVPHLYRLFYAMTGHPIKEYIRKRRTSEAAVLLRATAMAANEIGFRCGFDTGQTFIHTFKRFTGLTPGVYRQSDLYYSFEKISLLERVAYLEERDVTERYADIKVVRLKAIKGIGYLYTSEREQNVEREAVERFRSLLMAAGLDAGVVRLFGWNTEDDSEAERPYGYQMLAVGGGYAAADLAGHPDLQPVELSGGLYAVSLVHQPSGDANIGAAWNRMYAEWLPRSAFELGEHRLFEEYVFVKDKLVRMKLHLPVTRSRSMKTIEVVRRPEVRVLSFRAEGGDCLAEADKASMAWLSASRLAGDERMQLFMSCSYGHSWGEDAVCTVMIAPPDDYAASAKEESMLARLESGCYARLITEEAYGTMNGILETIYRWLDASREYEPDTERSWYAHYLPDATAACYVPVVKSNNRRIDHEPDA